MSDHLMNAFDAAYCRYRLPAAEGAGVWSVVTDSRIVEWITQMALVGMLARERSRVPR